ncbi:DJ-1/PfpI family protein [Crossiella cryophila]|uniref:Transcriptional regulator GlxA family with amidase domain n=1 Tax=Crossiella cryophila TaxID=43355 RepID=A0A7W7CCE3_9PSEU|nr:DJ-1/PfpI family protein [Crossiella cryophila]MBB4678540.1 transcriptional regulator GlxA family with amidase domain [Crossiella cryophila]
MRFQVLMFDGVEEQDFVAPVEVLGLAAKLSPGAIAPPVMVSTGSPGVVTCTYRTRVEVPGGWAPESADVLVVPGGGYNLPPSGEPRPGVRKLMRDKEFLGRLARVRVPLVGICTGVMVLAAAGLTRGRTATTHGKAKADLAALGTTVVDARVVDDGDLVTGGGVTSGLDVALWLVERYAGARVALAAEEVMEYERRGTVWHA